MSRNSCMYLYIRQQYKFISEIDKIKDFYFERLKRALSVNPEIEAQQYRNEKWEQIISQCCSEKYSDFNEVIEQVDYEGFLYYNLLNKGNYRILAMWICCLYETWEQQVLCFIRQEIDNGDLYNEKIPQKYEGIERLWKRYGMDIKKWKCWEKLNECRLVTNVIKHGEGQSEKELRQLRSNLFEFKNSNCEGQIDSINLYHTTLDEITLNITEQDLIDYSGALIDFWKSIPVNCYILNKGV